ncbi:MMPL family transporter [Gordonia sp. NPDC062954]|uniref:MMPL family transporter n=1 Tax=unclassified Gordonia (in: high G+C Gram-positive bacteria) TaxID=2657482 RepID=UPI000C456C9C|nr:MMPL family transporter [Gordonia sp. (in: high G+C Gram-positive bacteria)]MAU83414.1 hypothetical protein [Gordonia sp. (in: high G+C Gram-positive bacteria)]
MAERLYRIGRWCYQHRFATIGVWVLALIVLAAAAAVMSKPASTSFSIPGIPSEQAQNTMVERFPDKPKFGEGVSITYVVRTPDGAPLTEPLYQEAIDGLVEDIKGIDGVRADAVVNPFTMYGTADAPGPARQQVVTFHEQAFGDTPGQAQQDAQITSPITADATAAQIGASFVFDSYADVPASTHEQIEQAAEDARAAGLDVAMSGTALPQPEISFVSELLGVAVAAIVLILTFASLVAWGMPLITAIVGVGVGMLGISAASYFFELSSETPILATMIGLAVGIDYALFILSRYRHELHRSASRAEAAGRAVGTAGSAVVFAGLTVFIALAALAVVNIPFLTAMGIAAAGTVAVAVAVALTLLPAVLALFGGRAFGGRLGFLNAPDVAPNEVERRHNGRRWVELVMRRPAVVTVAVVVLLAILTIPISGLRLALPGDGTADPSTPERQAYEMVADEFGAGYNGPLVMVVDGQGIADPTERMQEFDQLLQQVRGVDDVADAVIGADGLNEARDTAIITVIPESASTDQSTHDLVNELRGMESAVAERGLTYGVTGQTAIEIDISDRLSSSLLPYVIIVVGLAFLLLMVVFRSILVPLTAAVGFLLTVGATFGVTIALFSDGWFGLVEPQPLVSFFPIMLVGIVFGLAMDYQVFLVSRMREAYVHGSSAREAIAEGFSHSARVVAAAATIMISVFAAFMLQELAFIKAMGFALAAAVFFDAFLVRMTLIPAVLALLGDRAWQLPKWLDRLIPRVDIEGEKLGAAGEDSVDEDSTTPDRGASAGIR